MIKMRRNVKYTSRHSMSCACQDDYCLAGTRNRRSAPTHDHSVHLRRVVSGFASGIAHVRTHDRHASQAPDPADNPSIAIVNLKNP